MIRRALYNYAWMDGWMVGMRMNIGKKREQEQNPEREEICLITSCRIYYSPR